MTEAKKLPTVHLEGMGVMGALTAYQLQRLGIPFTWHDIETPEKEAEVSPTDFFTAWHASTGAVFPTGSEDDMRCLRRYEDELLAAYPEAVFSKNEWVYGAKKPPHSSKSPVVREIDHLKVSECPAYNCDAQLLVRQARKDFEEGRISAEEAEATKPNVDLYFISHGWGDRQTHVYWGWTRLVKLNMDERLAPNSCFYFRKDRFFITYAYPVGESGWWYAGSTITQQKGAKPATHRMEKEYARWKANFEELCDGLVTVGEEGPYIEGWRPAGGKMHDTSWEQYSVNPLGDNVFQYPCRSHDGIRRFPDIWDQVAKIIQEAS